MNNTASLLNRGPIANPNDYLDEDWWKSMFDENYQRTNSMFTTAEITKREVETIKQVLDLRKDETILDMACVAGRHSLELASQGYQKIHAIDFSGHSLSLGQEKNRRFNLNVRFKKGDIRNTGYKNASFDKVMLLGNSWGYLHEDSDNLKVIEEVFRILKPGGTFLLDNANGGYIMQNYIPFIWRWTNSNEELACYERKIIEKRMVTREILVSPEVGVTKDHIYSVRLYSRDEVEQVFEMIGFEDIKFHSEIFVNPEDPKQAGCWGNRILATGRKP